MTRQTDMKSHRNRLIALAKELGIDRYSYTGDDHQLGFTYRADDLAVIWTGEATFVIAHHFGPVVVKTLVDDRRRIPQLIEDMCTGGDEICEMIASHYREEVLKEAVASVIQPATPGVH